ncbi:glycoside hydrolase family 44 protein [Clostridium cibarium]|uniref:glycoside hydrolase family 44 protein n=1 Tax=Clostridium cibarium TaxID=2762247 RepID=UPI001FACBE0A|nr:glycoside hydrolase family 44 protein [Clostridium cibarium]
MKLKKLVSLCLAFAVTSSFASYNMVNAEEGQVNNINVSIDTNSERQDISPYIYGSNNDFGGNQGTITQVATALRDGGNRFTGYNWENNASNAGSDYKHQSDNYLNMNSPYSEQNIPGQVVTSFHDGALKTNSKYSLVTLQMAGYVAKDKSGPVSEAEVAPSSRWLEVKPKKDSAFADTPDVNDNAVYMDEFVNFLTKKYGKADTTTGIKGYSLDNEPGLWSSTHSRIHPKNVTCSELLEKSIAYSKAVKDVDPKAEIFGPALYGMMAYQSLQKASDWDAAKAEGKYSWFVDYYLDKMKQAETTEGKRLLDVFDFHYYPEAKGGGVRVTEKNDPSNIECNKARIQATRTLWDSNYKEDSWIGQWCKDQTPIIPKMQASINKYYPGTKLAITEYNFGGGDHISGGIAQADAFGIFANQNVYFASLWGFNGDTNYTQAAFNLYRNYDGKNSTYGDIKVKANTSDIENSSVYSAVDSKDSNKLHVILINKNYDKPMKINVNLAGDKKYTSGKVWGFDKDSSDIKEKDSITNIKDNSFTYEVPQLSVCHLVLDAKSQDNPQPTDPTKSKSGFVKANGSEFSLDGSSFYFQGTNNYYLPYAPDYMVDDVFNKAKTMGLKVMRTWGFLDGDKSCDIVLQPSLGVYDENGFKKFDYVVKKAQEAGMKLVIPFINNWKDFGGIDKYVQWTGAGSHDKFYTNEACKTAYKNYINHFLNRTNSLTGVKYKDDPTIMTWELGNEPRCGDDKSGATLYNWVKEMSEYIKSIDPDHMVAVGDEGFFNRKDSKYSSDYDYNGGAGVDWDKIVALPSIDYGTYHLYPDGWGRSVEWGTQWIKDHIDAAKAVNKPAVLEEYGIKSNQESVYKTWNDTVLNYGGAGSMFWILTAVGFDGKQDYPDYDGFRVLYPSSIANVIMDSAKAMSDKNKPYLVIGDVDGDGEVTMADCIALKKYLISPENKINEKNADINQDKEVDISDLFALYDLL